MAKPQRSIRISPVLKDSRLKHSEKVVRGVHVAEAPSGVWMVHETGKRHRFTNRDEAIGYAKERVSTNRPIFIHESGEPVKVLTSKTAAPREARKYIAGG